MNKLLPVAYSHKIIFTVGTATTLAAYFRNEEATAFQSYSITRNSLYLRHIVVNAICIYNLVASFQRS